MMTIDDLYERYPDVLPDRSEMRFLDGWSQILEPLLKELRRHGGRLEMAKEKFGEMRVHVGGVDRGQIQDTVECLRLRSRFTCEQCGKPGRQRSNHGYIFAACDEHGLGIEPMKEGHVITWTDFADPERPTWRTYIFDERDRQVTITWGLETENDDAERPGAEAPENDRECHDPLR